MIKYRIMIVSDKALSVEFADDDPVASGIWARELAAFLEGSGKDWLDGVKVFSKSVTLIYNPAYCGYRSLSLKLRLIIFRIERTVQEKISDKSRKSKVHYIPVCYGDTYAKDMAWCAERLGISRDELVGIHTGKDLLVKCHLYYGQACLSPVCEREGVRTDAKRVAAGDILFDGSVTLIAASDQESDLPVIGHTYVKTYDTSSSSSIFAEGDYVRFVSVGENKFKKLSDKGAYDTEMRRVGVHNEDNNS